MTLKLDHADVIMIFTAVSNYYLSLESFVDSDRFFKQPEQMQELYLEMFDQHKDLYRRLSEYMTEHGEVMASAIYKLDTDIKPKKEIE